MYESERELSGIFFSELLPRWEDLSWAEKDAWQERADELNEARYDNDL